MNQHLSGRQALPSRPLAPVQLTLLGEFRLQVDGHDVECPVRSQRLLGLLALKSRPVERKVAAAALWPDDPPDRGRASIRAAIFAVRRLPAEVLACEGHVLALGPQVAVDVAAALAQARHALGEDDGDAVELDLELLQRDLLESWDDEWVAIERERFRQLRLHALESACRRLAMNGSYSSAVDAGLRAISAEPFRESAYRALIEAHIAEGNPFEAARQYRTYTAMMRELGIRPSSAIGELVGDLASNGHINGKSVNGKPVNGKPVNGKPVNGTGPSKPAARRGSVTGA
jgi:DNA-binding SARP family transcriptional activator